MHLGLEGGRGERERPECLPRGAPTAPGMEQLLGVAINEGDAESARALLKKNRHLCNYVDPDMQGTLLQVAALKGHSDCVEALLEAGADMEIAHPIYGMTPFLWACQNTHLLCVQLLVRAGCNTAARDSSGLSGQELAKEDLHPGWEAIVKYLAEHTGKTIDITKELEFSTKQQRRMRKTLADAGDHDDALSLLFTTEQTQQSDEQKMRKKIRTLFQDIDEDGSGDLDRDEFAQLSKDMGADLTDAELDEVMREIDTNGDGNVDFEEFQTWWLNVGEEKSTWMFRVHLDSRKSFKAIEEEKRTAQKEAELRSAFTSDQIDRLLAVVDARLTQAREQSEMVTDLLTRSCKMCKGKMFGLEFNVKDRESTFSKVIRKMPPAHGMTPEEQTLQFTDALNSLRDLLRYTMVLPTKRYTQGVTGTIELLGTQNVQPIEGTVKNFWRRKGQDTDYLGINASFQTPEVFTNSGRVLEGMPFELQFHTNESIETKMHKAHFSFEQFRLTSGLEKLQYWEDMVRMWSMVPVPPGDLFAIGTKAYHGVDRAVLEATLTAEEHEHHTRRRGLQALVRPACDRVYADNLRVAEEFTPEIASRVQKEKGYLTGTEHICKTAMSMTRQIVEDLDQDDWSSDDRGVQAMLNANVEMEKRNALRYTMVFPENAYVRGAQRVLEYLKKAGFKEEVLNNYWTGAEPFNAVRGRFHMSEKDGEAVSIDLAVVFHTEESLEMSEERMVRYQEAMGIVFHTATLTGSDEAAESARKLMQEDPAWQIRVKGLSANKPKSVESIGRIIADKPGTKMLRRSVRQRSEDWLGHSIDHDSEQDDPGVVLSPTGTVRFENPLAERASNSGTRKSKKDLNGMSSPLSVDFDDDDQTEASSAIKDSTQKSGGIFGCCRRQNSDD